MRYLPTSDEVVERLRKQAKKLQRTGAGKHTDLLNRVAKQAGYDHWHHVTRCSENSRAVTQIRAIRDECEAIIAAELRGEVKAAMTSSGVACPPLVLFSTGVGDAWLLEPDEHLAMCLVWHGARQPIRLRDDPNRIEVEWDCAYELLGNFFSVESQHPLFGTQAIGGYGLDAVRMLLDQAQSPMMKMASIIGQFDAVEITAEVLSQMIGKGWDEEELLKLRADGYRYSPVRNSLLGPVISSEDEDS